MGAFTFIYLCIIVIKTLKGYHAYVQKQNLLKIFKHPSHDKVDGMLAREHACKAHICLHYLV